MDFMSTTCCISPYHIGVYFEPWRDPISQISWLW